MFERVIFSFIARSLLAENQLKQLDNMWHQQGVSNDDFKTKSNKAGYTATPVACGWAGAIFEVSGVFGQEQ